MELVTTLNFNNLQLVSRENQGIKWDQKVLKQTKMGEVVMIKKQKIRAGWRMGYLYKVAGNKEYPANHSTKGKYWLQLQINGKKKRIALKNEYGDRIVDFAEAQQIRQKLVAPLLNKELQNINEFLKSSILNLKEEEHQTNLTKNNILNNKDSNIKISNALDKYKKLRLDSNISKSHLNRTYSDCEHLIEYIQKNYSNKVYLSEIDHNHIKEFLSAYGNITSRTFNCRVSSLSYFFNIVMEDWKEQNPSYLNPVTRVKVKALNTENSHSKRVLSSEELLKVLEEAKKISQELHLMFLIGATTGLRLGDVTTLNWNEIDLEKELIHKIASKTKRHCTKPVVIGIVNVLKEALESIEKQEGDVLPSYSSYSNNKTSYNRIIAQVQTVFKNAGIVTSQARKIGTKGVRPIKIVGFHSLRHTFISKHAELGTPLAVIQQSVGHSNQAMTQHYMQINEKNVIEAAKNFKL